MRYLKYLFAMKYLILLFIFLSLLAFVYCIPKIFIWNILGYENWNIYSETGTIGDTFGGLSAPFIGIFNAILLIWTLLKQIDFEEKQDVFNRNQISNQKEDQFKSVFFQLIQRQHDMYKEVEGTFLSRFIREHLSNPQQKIVSGIIYFKAAKHELKTVFDVLEEKNFVDTDLQNLIKNKYNITNENINEYKNKSNKEKMKYAYKCFFDKHYELSNCHRHLYHILVFIKGEEDAQIELFKNKKEEIEKKYRGFADLLQATLTNDELLLFYYNCTCFKKTENLISHFQFVENLHKGNLFDRDRDTIDGINIKD